jgi:multidrug efflux pump subunit AcrA (membrane-fusion protein)
VRSRIAIALLLVLALIVGAIAIRAGAGVGAGALSRGGEKQAEEEDPEDPIIAPSRVVAGNDEPRVVLDSAEIRRIGLTTAPLADAMAERARRLYGQVVPEPERTVTIRAPVAGRLTALPGHPWPSLGDHLAADAPVGRVSDAQPLAVPIGGVVTGIGARPGEIVAAGQVLLELADNSRPVVRIVWPDDAGRASDRLTLLPDEADARIEAGLIGPAPEADPLTRRPAYLYRARARWPGAVPGTAVSAILPGDDETEGVLVPDRAVVQWEGLAWAYLQREPGAYARVRVPTSRPAPGGWIAGPPLAAGDAVVVTGTQELLSEEFRSRVTVGEESGE